MKRNSNKTVAWSATLFDAALNAGGIYPVATRIADTPTAAMLAQALNIGSSINSIAALVLAFLGGFVLSALPHSLWYADTDSDGFNLARGAAVVAQGLSYATTYAFIAAVLPSLPVGYTVLSSLALEFVLTMAKTVVFQKREA